MLFDEPFAGVDPITVAELQKEIARLRDRGLGVLITDHNVRDTLQHLRPGLIIAAGQDPRRGHTRRNSPRRPERPRRLPGRDLLTGLI